MYRPTSRQNTDMTSNYSTSSPVYSTSSTGLLNNMTKKDSCRCEKSYDGENMMFFLIITVYALVFLIILMAVMWLKKYRTLKHSITILQNSQQQAISLQSAETDLLEQSSGPEQIITGQLEQTAVSAPASSSFNKADVVMHQLIKAGREGMLYKAKMTRGAIKGHTMFTCKIYKKAAKHKQVRKEVMIMRNLNTHMNLLQLVDWDITEEDPLLMSWCEIPQHTFRGLVESMPRWVRAISAVPYMLIMEDVEHGSLRTFLSSNKESLCKEEELQHLFTIALYHIAQAINHLHSKMILHCDLALRNILVHRFPHEVKVAEFELARDIRRGQRLSGHCKKKDTKRVPFRWYPPEYFKHDFYGFKGDVWAFGIMIWEMQTFGTLPYPDLKTSEEVVSYVCAGHRAQEPEDCRSEMLQMMRDCWQEPYFKRPSFMDIVRDLEKILENDRDYMTMDSSTVLVSAESEDRQ